MRDQHLRERRRWLASTMRKWPQSPPPERGLITMSRSAAGTPASRRERDNSVPRRGCPRSEASAHPAGALAASRRQAGRSGLDTDLQSTLPEIRQSCPHAIEHGTQLSPSRSRNRSSHGELGKVVANRRKELRMPATCQYFEPAVWNWYCRSLLSNWPCAKILRVQVYLARSWSV